MGFERLMLPYLGTATSLSSRTLHQHSHQTSEEGDAELGNYARVWSTPSRAAGRGGDNNHRVALDTGARCHGVASDLTLKEARSAVTWTNNMNANHESQRRES